jgi:acetyl-CoA C-acetyltransferase
MNCQTVNKVCGSGLQAVMLAAQAIKAGDAQTIVAGGMENMSLAPHMVYARAGIKLGSVEFMDHMVADGLTCPFENWGMGKAAEWIASEFKISREDQDQFAVRSNKLAAESTAKGFFKSEMVALSAEQLGQKAGCDADEGFRADSSMEALAKLRPAFDKAGTVTAGNASQISDGACALVVTTAAKAEELKLRPLARIVAYHTSGTPAKELFTAPALAIPAVLKKAGLKVDDIDLFEINEAFAAQILHNIRQLGIPLEKLNVCGGGIALGHPIGASGARVLTTLVHQLARLNKKRGVAALCLGGGNAVTMVVER